jgi:hypothetical protein
MPNGPLAAALRAAEPRPESTGKRGDKKNYAERLSRFLAQQLANSLRKSFPEVLPDLAGRFHESRSAAAHGVKKLDVNFSTPEIGLGFGVSVKTLNFRDPRTNRYTKNYTRIDNELRAEAIDYHLRQPYSVMVAVIFLPEDSVTDGVSSPSSYASAVQHFRKRAGREKPSDDPQLFEHVFIGLYSLRDSSFGDVTFTDVMTPPPKSGPPKEEATLSYDALIEEIEATFWQRNNPPAEWAD